MSDSGNVSRHKRIADRGDRPLLIGELNPYGGDPYFALYPLPKNAAGDRLCHLVLGLQMTEYLRIFDRVNICTGRWDPEKAAARVSEILEGRRGGPISKKIILLGERVTTAFRMQWRPFTYDEYIRAEGSDLFDDRPDSDFTFEFICLPHPSGRSTSYNDPRRREEARSLLRSRGVLTR